MCTRTKQAWQLLPDFWANSDKPPQPQFHPPSPADRYKELLLPCRNKCIECLRGHASQRGLQLWAETQTTTGESWFITPTYDDSHIPVGHTLDKTHPTLFYKQIRNYRTRTNQIGKFRYEGRWEYGTTTFRPHGHVAAFNLHLSYDDLEIWKDCGNYKLYKSKILTKIWAKGDVTVTPLTQACATYISSHDYKKIGLSPIHKRDFYHQKTGKLILPPLLETLDKTTGELTMEPRREREYTTRSGKPGIGYEWFQKHGISDLWQDTMVGSDYQEHKMPAYFFNLIKKEAPDLHEIMLNHRVEYAESHIKTTEENLYQEKYNKLDLKNKQQRDKI